MQFQPSHLSGPQFAIPNAKNTAIDVLTLGSSALWRGYANIGSSLLGKDSAYAHAASQAGKHQRAYLKCKERREKKGKEAYPLDTSRSAMSSNCHTDYLRWKAWEQKAAERARTLMDKLAKSGKLSQETAEELRAAQAEPDKIARIEWNADKQKRRARARAKNKSEKEAEASVPPLETYQAPEATTEEEDASSVGTYVLVAGAVLGLAGGAWWWTRRPKHTAP